MEGAISMHIFEAKIYLLNRLMNSIVIVYVENLLRMALELE